VEQPAETLQAALRSETGIEARLATDTDAVAGVTPRVVCEPDSEDAVASVLAYAEREGLAVCVRGGGTQLSMGFPPTRLDILLSTARLSRVLEHAPHDLTVTVEAGLTLQALQRTLGSARQWLALDPPVDEGATIGGIIATNASGPRRLRFGGVRDQIIGVRVALPDGTLAQGGGKVVKNVAGYDLPRLYTGSLGTLGVIVSATFRLYPLPEFVETVVASSPALRPLIELASHIRHSQLVPVALDIMQMAPDEEFTLLARFESGVREAVQDQAATVERIASEYVERSQVRREEGNGSATWAAAAALLHAPGKPPATIVKASMLLSGIGTWLDATEEIAKELSLSLTWRAHVGHGLIYVRVPGTVRQVAAFVERGRAAAAREDGSLVVVEAVSGLASEVDLWGPTQALDLMRRVKQRFDPQSVLNPGRFIGGI